MGDTSPKKKKQIYEILQESRSKETILVKADAIDDDMEVDMENDMPNTPEENFDLCNLTNDSSDIENEVKKTEFKKPEVVPQSPIVLEVQKEIPWIPEEISAEIKSAESKTVETIESSSSSKSEKRDSAILVPARKRKMS